MIVNHQEAMENEVIDRLSYHPETETTGPLHEAARQQHQALALWIVDVLPESRERSLALTAVQEALMWTNAAIAYRLPRR